MLCKIYVKIMYRYQLIRIGGRFGSEAGALSPGVSCCVLTIEALLRSECEQQATAPAVHKTAFTATLRHERTSDDPATQRDTDR